MKGITMSKKLWLCGQNKSGEWPDVVWEFQGAFDSEEKAIEACRDENYFIIPFTLNKQFSPDSIDEPGAYYPLEVLSTKK
jgi:hypothetical protein